MCRDKFAERIEQLGKHITLTGSTKSRVPAIMPRLEPDKGHNGIARAVIPSDRFPLPLSPAVLTVCCHCILTREAIRFFNIQPLSLPPRSKVKRSQTLRTIKKIKKIKNGASLFVSLFFLGWVGMGRSFSTPFFVGKRRKTGVS